MGGASDNHVTVNHVTVWEASSTQYWSRRFSGLNVYFSLCNVRSTCIQITLRELALHQTDVSVISAVHHLVLGETIALLFSRVCDNYYCVPLYVNIKCLQFNFSCLSLSKYSVLDYQQDSLMHYGKMWLVVQATIIHHIKFLYLL